MKLSEMIEKYNAERKWLESVRKAAGEDEFDIMAFEGFTAPAVAEPAAPAADADEAAKSAYDEAHKAFKAAEAARYAEIAKRQEDNATLLAEKERQESIEKMDIGEPMVDKKPAQVKMRKDSTGETVTVEAFNAQKALGNRLWQEPEWQNRKQVSKKGNKFSLSLDKDSQADFELVKATLTNTRSGTDYTDEIDRYPNIRSATGALDMFPVKRTTNDTIRYRKVTRSTVIAGVDRDTGSETSITITQSELPSKKLLATLPVSNDYMEDDEMAMDQVTDDLMRSMRIKMLTEVMQGDPDVGAGWTGMGSDTLGLTAVAIAASTNIFTGVAATQANGLDNLIDVLADYGVHPSHFLCNFATARKVYQESRKNGFALPEFMRYPYGGSSGVPAVPTSYAGTNLAYIGNWDVDYIYVALRADMEIESSEHNEFELDNTVLRATARGNLVVPQPGAFRKITATNNFTISA